ncbi:MAG: hypothetical protein HDQ99_02440 [Lachnospiraceae bacterium]|nr:hypothetical protein [Lachnospiraceae bacterium]
MFNLINFEDELLKYGLTTETYEAACKDIDMKQEGSIDLDWSEIKDKYGIDLASDSIRKANGTIFGGSFRTAYLKNQIYTNPEEFSKEKELDKKLADIRKERIKLQTANIERGRVDRNESRHEMYYEYVGSVSTSLPLPEFQPLCSNDKKDIEYLMALADIHYGAKFTSENNKYSPEIAKERFECLSGQVIDFVQKHNVTKLNIVSLGDLVQGILRVSDLKINDSTVVKATVEISRLIALFLSELSIYINIEYYHTPSANHSQLRPLGTKASEIADEDLEYLIGNYIKDLCSGNERITVHLADEGKQYIEIPIMGNEIIAMHGHQLKNIENSIRDLSMLRRSFIDYLILGHFHSGKEIPSFEGCCNDTEILVSPSFVGSDPYSDSIMKGSKSSVKIYGFSDIYGHIETYKFILN